MLSWESNPLSISFLTLAALEPQKVRGHSWYKYTWIFWSKFCPGCLKANWFQGVNVPVPDRLFDLYSTWRTFRTVMKSRAPDWLGHDASIASNNVDTGGRGVSDSILHKAPHASGRAFGFASLLLLDLAIHFATSTYALTCFNVIYLLYCSWTHQFGCLDLQNCWELRVTEAAFWNTLAKSPTWPEFKQNANVLGTAVGNKKRPCS